MKTILTSLFIVVLTAFQQVSFAQISLIDTETIVHKSLFLPDNLTAVSSSKLLITDLSIDFPVYMIDIVKDEIIAKIQRGNGPGELSFMDKSISVTKNGIYIWDYGLQILNHYDDSLNFITAKRLSKTEFVSDLLTDGTYLYLIENSNEFIKIYEFDQIKIIGKHLKTYSTGDYPEFDQFNNYGIRQSFKVKTDNNHNLILSNEFTSLVFSVNKDGINFMTAEPANLVQKVSAGDFNATDIAYNAMCSLSLGIDNAGIIYSLFKGGKVSITEIADKFSNRMQDFLDDFTASDKLLIYGDGKYQETINLPARKQKIEVWQDNLFTLYMNNGYPEIRLYKIQQSDNE